jgi:hypothetical protein
MRASTRELLSRERPALLAEETEETAATEAEGDRQAIREILATATTGPLEEIRASQATPRLQGRPAMAEEEKTRSMAAEEELLEAASSQRTR